MQFVSRPGVRAGAAIFASGAMAALYVRGGHAWLLGFVFLVPWLRSLDASPTLGATLLRAYGMTLAYTGAAFAWFGIAAGQYAQLGAPAGVVLLLLAAPLFQPQFLLFALVRHAALRRHGPLAAALAGAAAWVASEWLLPKLLGDTIGYGLYPSSLLRQGAALGGAAGLTLVLLLANEGLAGALARRRHGLRAIGRPLAAAALLPLLLTGYGMAVLSHTEQSLGQPLRVGLVQANITSYERQRQEKGTYGVVREVLDTHFAMSYDAVERQQADAVLWSETAYPTTFGSPKSEAGAQFDAEIVSIVKAAGVPFVFGTYDRDGAGEYNAAAFVQPNSGLMGFYRKTNLFPLTEYLPSWMERHALRRLVPWAGDWRPGNGARVFPLLLKDGREVPVLPMICYDAVTPHLAINGARLGAQAILTMSNDSWFTAGSLGAQMHQSAAAFRSIETGLPQFRVTTNGYSAVIDASGAIVAGARMGERTLVVGALPVGVPRATLMVRWGDWVGLASAVFLAALLAWSALRWWQPRLAAAAPAAASWPLTVSLLPPAARWIAAALGFAARAGLLYMCVALLANEALRTNTLAQVRMFSTFFLAPAAAAWCVLYLFAARATMRGAGLVLARGRQQETIAVNDVAAIRTWRVLLPGPGLSLWLANGRRLDLALARPLELSSAIAAAGGPLAQDTARPWAALQAYVQASLALRRSWLDHPLVRYALLSLALAIPAFHLQQQIAYGGPFGEYYTYGLKAYVTAFAIWWAAWAIGVALTDYVLRALTAALTMLAALVRPGRAVAVRRSLHSASHAALFLGLPAWFMLTVFGR